MAYANNIIIDGTPIEINVSTINGFTVNKNVPADAVLVIQHIPLEQV